MQPKPTRDFKRVLRNFCQANGLTYEEEKADGPNERIVITWREGRRHVRVVSFIIRNDQSEITQPTARRIVDAVVFRFAKEAAKIASDEIVELLKELVEILRRLFE